MAAPTCGAAAEVPEKLGKASLSISEDPPKSTVVLAPLGPQISGLFLNSPSTLVPPLDENEATVGISHPKLGVLR